jgi:hypothetical protein
MWQIPETVQVKKSQERNNKRSVRMTPPKTTAANLLPMSNDERAKLKRFTLSIDFSGDLSKAARKARVSKGLLDKWMSTPKISQHVTNWIKWQRRREAARLVAWAKCHSKIFPIWFKDACIDSRRPLTIDDLDLGNWLPYAKFTAQTLKRSGAEFWDALLIVRPIGSKHFLNRFFIDLGKCLSGEIKCELWDKMDVEVAEIVLCNPSISAKAGVPELKKWGDVTISEDNFRMRKMRLKRVMRERDAFDRGSMRFARAARLRKP